MYYNAYSTREPRPSAILLLQGEISEWHFLSIRLRAEQLQGLEKFAKERHLSVGWCIRAAVDEWLKKNAKNI